MTRVRTALPIAAAVAVATGVTAAMLAPADQLQGDLQRLMYVHVPAAWTAYLSFAVTLVASIGWLWRRKPGFDRVAASSAEVGVFFTALAIALGSIWGKPVWGVWWTWDPRLITTALMLFVYLGYLALRRATLDPDARARRAAVFGVVAFVQVPIVHMSVEWWRTLHQPATVLQPGQPSIDTPMLITLLINVVAFMLIYAVLLRLRLGIAAMDDQRAARQVAEGRELAGGAVTAPHLEDTQEKEAH
ncbi:cytochrome c biogenesis protein CcsA [Haloechinothrix sp. LS1_15]|uniref:cytochrome c biogenesis protein CcsA n=1 Tax=Haloechinothrix sp. LS1_15 TaxID=2652248 RepID=UPI0029488B62|nr:cytochrome c biogenesis protein CcsA [Haloechinothrix sp. LS1_15]MDV6011856.1 cytochrome C biogenesis protein [Haloechinothrix sp. LS1_15]